MNYSQDKLISICIIYFIPHHDTMF